MLVEFVIVSISPVPKLAPGPVTYFHWLSAPDPAAPLKPSLNVVDQPDGEKLCADAGKIAEEIARSIDADPEDVFHVLRHLASNDPHVRVTAGDQPVDDKFSLAE